MNTDRTDEQVQGFTPNGMLERWNIGNIGLGVMECWVNGKIRLDENNNGITSFKKPSIP